MSALPSPRSARKTPVPLLLSEFPTPPTFIPQTPTPAPPSASFNLRMSFPPNPPPSRPPSSPLPPLPGPSPISEQDLIFISSSSRSRRASRISTYSRGSSPTPSRRDSTASFTSGSSGPSTLPASPIASTHTFGPISRNRTESLTSISTRSVRSFSSAGSLSVPGTSYTQPTAPLRMSMDDAILEDEEYHSPTEPRLTRLSLADIPRVTPSPQPPMDADESISSITMQDLPALHEDDGAALSAQALHFEMRAVRSKSETHKLRLRRGGAPDAKKPAPRKASTGSSNAPSAFNSRRSVASEPDRSSSPDIASIIAATPRPRRTSEASSTRAEASLPGSRRTSLARRESGGSVGLSYLKDDAGWNEDSFVEDYGVVIKGGDGGGFGEVLDVDLDGDVEAAEAAEDSDSSLDLHTPLPNLMLRDGLLSPHSKILPQNLRSDSPSVVGGNPLEGDRPGSILSIASTSMTKSGVFKDERDTVKRRVRHRDGRLLRGGIGLTTGLGWSDSEDEDAPSPFTKRLSNLALSRKSSSSSSLNASGSARATPSPRPHPLSRSFSSDSAPSKSKRVPASEKDKQKGRSSLPPTAWQKRSTDTSDTSLAVPALRLPATPTRFSEPPSPRIAIPSVVTKAASVRTPSTSTSSSLSIPAPVTPGATEMLEELLPSPDGQWGREKSLPPLPLSLVPSLASLIKTPSYSLLNNNDPIPPVPSTPKPNRSSAASDSSGSYTGTMGHDVPIPPSARPPLPVTRSASTPRPLHLAASLSLSLSNGSLSNIGIQPGEPTQRQGLLLGYNRQLHDQQRARAASGPASSVSANSQMVGRPILTPSLPGGNSLDGLADVKPRPRTGTGMVYKRSPTAVTPAGAGVQAQSRMRIPAVPAARVGGTVAL